MVALNKTIAIIQARMGSTRLPNKILMPIAGKAIIQHVVDRCIAANCFEKVIVAIPDTTANDKLADYLKEHNIDYFRSSEDDVLKRYYDTALHYDGAKYNIARVTSDNPCLPPQQMRKLVARFIELGNVDLIDNSACPVGTGIEVLTFKALEEAMQNATLDIEREHVTPYIRTHEEYNKASLKNEPDLSHLRLTIDTPEDFALVEHIFNGLYPKNNMFEIAEIVEFLDANPELAQINAHIQQVKVC